jgi:UDP-N-acetylmuramoyl-L-alanyl-D-glutamate--2,6-diaminopimelate ligase
VSIRSITGSTDTQIHDVQIDSRKTKPGVLFVAVKGTTADGHQFIDKAVENGAAVIVYETAPAQMSPGLVWVQVENSASAAGYIAHNFFGHPSEKMKVVGVTGTNGKTTIATLLFRLFSGLGCTCGLLSTVENHIGDTIVPATHTTPDAVSLNQLLKQMLDAGCTHVFMEVSSHAVHQNRTRGINFAGGVFSNITHDHLDYHKSFDEYIRVKKSFFDSLSSSSFAISNADDKRGGVMLQNTNAKKYFYSLKTLADFKGKIIENSLSGLVMTINDQEVHFG